MKKTFLFISLFICLACQKQESMEELTARVFERAAAQMVLMDKTEKMERMTVEKIAFSSDILKVSQR